MEDPDLSVAARLVAVMLLVLANGFFVAAEFSLVTVRRDQGMKWSHPRGTEPDSSPSRRTRSSSEEKIHPRIDRIPGCSAKAYDLADMVDRVHNGTIDHVPEGKLQVLAA